MTNVKAKTNLEIMVNKFDELPFSGRKSIVGPLLTCERWQVFVSVSSQTKIIDCLAIINTDDARFTKTNTPFE